MQDLLLGFAITSSHFLTGINLSLALLCNKSLITYVKKGKRSDVERVIEKLPSLAVMEGEVPIRKNTPVKTLMKADGQKALIYLVDWSY